MISRSIGIVPSVSADDECNVCVAQMCQLICLFDQVWFSSGKLLRLCLGCIRHLRKLSRGGQENEQAYIAQYFGGKRNLHLAYVWISRKTSDSGAHGAISGPSWKRLTTFKP